MSASAELLQVFWGLAQPAPEDRVKSARDLILVLHKEQTAYEQQRSAQSSSSAEKVKAGVNLAWSPGLYYALKRLARGMVSSNAGARQGFSLGLTEVLQIFPIVSTKEFNHIVSTEMKLPAAASRAVSRSGY
jgi:DNA polymerase phi